MTIDLDTMEARAQDWLLTREEAAKLCSELRQAYARLDDLEHLIGTYRSHQTAQGATQTPDDGNPVEDENVRLRAHLQCIRAVVDEQAENEALWVIDLDGQPISEAFLQQELRRLHEAIEGGPNNRILGQHWLEVAYERIRAGEPEEQTMADYGYVRSGERP